MSLSNATWLKFEYYHDTVIGVGDQVAFKLNKSAGYFIDPA